MLNKQEVLTRFRQKNDDLTCPDFQLWLEQQGILKVLDKPDQLDHYHRQLMTKDRINTPEAILVMMMEEWGRICAHSRLMAGLDYPPCDPNPILYLGLNRARKLLEQQMVGSAEMLDHIRSVGTGIGVFVRVRGWTSTRILRVASGIPGQTVEQFQQEVGDLTVQPAHLCAQRYRARQAFPSAAMATQVLPIRHRRSDTMSAV